MGEEFFKGLDEEKQSYVKVGGKLLKETTNSCLKQNKTKKTKINLGPIQRAFVFPSERIAIFF